MPAGEFTLLVPFVENANDSVPGADALIVMSASRPRDAVSEPATNDLLLQVM